MREDRSLIVIMHLSSFFAGFIIPLVLWSSQKDKLIGMDNHGKAAVNFNLSILLYFFIWGIGVSFLSLVPLLGAILAFLLVPLVFVLFIFIFPIINALKASNGDRPYYPLSIQFIK